MNETRSPGPKKSVALSGVVAGNSALCTVGRTGNDLHYRGYDILEIANVCEFEEIAYLLIHGKLPTVAELSDYKSKLRSLRGLPGPVRTALEALPASSHPMDVLRSGVSVLGCALPEKEDHSAAGARDIADRLIASLGSMLTYWYHWSHSGERIHVEKEMALCMGLDRLDQARAVVAAVTHRHLLHHQIRPAGGGDGRGAVRCDEAAGDGAAGFHQLHRFAAGMTNHERRAGRLERVRKHFDGRGHAKPPKAIVVTRSYPTRAARAAAVNV